MSDFERLRALISGASTAADKEAALAYIAAARSVGRRLHEDLRLALKQIEAFEAHWVRAARGEQISITEGP